MAGYVTFWLQEAQHESFSVACPILGGQGCYNTVSELHFSTLSLKLCEWKLKRTFQRIEIT
jgi:hypothetical protein